VTWTPRAKLYLQARERLLMRVRLLLDSGGEANVLQAAQLHNRAIRALGHAMDDGYRKGAGT
jgi:hypothetical protein